MKLVFAGIEATWLARKNGSCFEWIFCFVFAMLEEARDDVSQSWRLVIAVTRYFGSRVCFGMFVTTACCDRKKAMRCH